MKKFNTTVAAAQAELLNEMYGFDSSRSISKEQLSEIIRSITVVNTPIALTTITDATYKKKNDLGTIFKLSQLKGNLNVEYSKRMNEVNPEYKPGRTYGDHESGSLIRYNGKIYLQVEPLEALTPVFIVRDTIGQFRLSNREEVAPYIALPHNSISTGEKPGVNIRKYNFDSIVGVEVEGKCYQISDLDEVRKGVLNTILSK
jgi:hypothetical protein